VFINELETCKIRIETVTRRHLHTNKTCPRYFSPLFSWVVFWTEFDTQFLVLAMIGVLSRNWAGFADLARLIERFPLYKMTYLRFDTLLHR